MKAGFIKTQGFFYSSGWLGPRTTAWPTDPGALTDPMTLQQPHLCTLQGWRPRTRGQREARGEAGRSRGLQRSARDLRGRLLPWAAHTYTCKVTWETHTRAHAHTSLKPEGDNPTTKQILGQTRVNLWISLWKYHTLIVKAFQELLQHGSMCMFAGESQAFYLKKRQRDTFEKNQKVPSWGIHHDERFVHKRSWRSNQEQIHNAGIKR